MKKLFSFILISAFFLACGGGTEVTAEQIEAGKKTYTKLCVACHGSTGEMSLNGAKKFSQSTLSLDERILVITNGKNMMTPYKGILSEKEIREVAAYTIELTKAGKK